MNIARSPNENLMCRILITRQKRAGVYPILTANNNVNVSIKLWRRRVGPASLLTQELLLFLLILDSNSFSDMNYKTEMKPTASYISNKFTDCGIADYPYLIISSQVLTTPRHVIIRPVCQ